MRTCTTKHDHCQVYRNKNIHVLLGALKVSLSTPFPRGENYICQAYLKDVRCKLYSSIFIVQFDHSVEHPGFETSTTYHTLHQSTELQQ